MLEDMNEGTVSMSTWTWLLRGQVEAGEARAWADFEESLERMKKEGAQLLPESASHLYLVAKNSGQVQGPFPCTGSLVEAPRSPGEDGSPAGGRNGRDGAVGVREAAAGGLPHLRRPPRRRHALPQGLPPSSAPLQRKLGKRPAAAGGEVGAVPLPRARRPQPPFRLA